MVGKRVISCCLKAAARRLNKTYDHKKVSFCRLILLLQPIVNFNPTHKTL
jgi:hypothetical protein